MIRRTQRLAPVLLLLLAAACGASPSGEAAGTARVRVVATLYPLAFAAEAVAPPATAVRSLTPTGAEPHDLEPTPGDVRALLEADLVVYAAGFQPAVDRVVRRRRGRSLDVLGVAGLAPLAPGGGPRSPEDAPAAGEGRGPRGRTTHGHPEAAADPHLWLDPRRYGVVARALAAALGPGAEASPFERRLAELDREVLAGLAGCRRRRIVLTHAGFGYLADRYGLEQVALAGVEPEAEPGPRDLERLIGEARASGATTVFTEPLAPAAVAETVARAIGARTATLDPIEALTREQAARGEDYFTLMRANLGALRQGLDCPPSSS